MSNGKLVFGEYLKNLRIKKNLTLNSLAKQAGLSPSYLSRIERGKRNTPHAHILKKLAPHLGRTPRELMVAAGYLNNDLDEAENIYKGNQDHAAGWQEIIKDPALTTALEEIGCLTSHEKEGLLLFLRAIKLRRDSQK